MMLDLILIKRLSGNMQYGFANKSNKSRVEEKSSQRNNPISYLNPSNAEVTFVLSTRKHQFF